MNYIEVNGVFVLELNSMAYEVIQIINPPIRLDSINQELIKSFLFKKKNYTTYKLRE